MKKQADISYTDSRGNVFDLMVDDVRRITSANFHKYEWQKEVTEKRFGEILRGWKKTSPEYEVVILFTGTEEQRVNALNSFHDALEFDIKNATPGTLKWNDYYIKAFGVSSITEPAQDYADATANQINFYCPDPWWKKVTQYSFVDLLPEEIEAYILDGSEEFSRNWLSTEEGGEPLVPDSRKLYKIMSEGEYHSDIFKWDEENSIYVTLTEDWVKDYEEDYDYQYDYMENFSTNVNIGNSNALGSKWIITISGLAIGPFLQFINNDEIALTISFPYVEIPNGARLEIDSSEKTAIMILADGSRINCFGARDPEYYLWYDIPAGKNQIVWDKSFKFDVTLIEERSEPRWLTD